MLLHDLGGGAHGLVRTDRYHRTLHEVSYLHGRGLLDSTTSGFHPRRGRSPYLNPAAAVAAREHSDPGDPARVGGAPAAAAPVVMPAPEGEEDPQQRQREEETARHQ